MMVVITTTAILVVVIAYILVILTSSKRIIQEQQTRIDEIRKSEERYKALFQNSLAGMMKFDYTNWIIQDANMAMMEMFNATSIYDLQCTISDFPDEKLRQIETALRKTGIIDGLELTYTAHSSIKRRCLFSARREEKGNYAHAVLVLMTAEKMIG